MMRKHKRRRGLRRRYYLCVWELARFIYRFCEDLFIILREESRGGCYLFYLFYPQVIIGCVSVA